MADVRIGMLVPSSNTALEPLTDAMLSGVPGVSVHYTRIRVTEIALTDKANGQFGLAPMTAAAGLLADAGVDLIVWNGTAGSWLGLAHDLRLCEAIAGETGIPAATSTQAIVEAVRAAGIGGLSLVTPYTGDVNARIASTYAAAGIRCAGNEGLGLTVNKSFADVPEETIARMLDDAVRAPGTEGVAVVCTNMRGAAAAAEAERRHGLPAIDSVAATAWHALRLAGVPRAAYSALSGRWGSIFRLG